jgi:hypothetical protein
MDNDETVGWWEKKRMQGRRNEMIHMIDDR